MIPGEDPVNRSAQASIRPETDCSFELMSDGKLHCVPEVLTGPTPIVAYSDPDCTVEEAYAIQPTCDAVPLPKYTGLYGDGTPNSCLRINTVYEIGESVPSAELPILYAKSGGACVEAPLASASAYLKLGARLPPSTFMESTIMVE